jgi:hypothetical protein
VQQGAFEGARVIEVAQSVFVAVARALLADWGDDLPRIEPAAHRGSRSIAQLRGAGVVP